jgi:deoxyribodipyrimidine photo-lyase
MNYPATRKCALEQLEAFLPAAPAYGGRRNFVSPGHDGVSRLSPAIRCRLITEYEVARRVLKEHGLRRTEKFIQEVYWHSYWKGWLEQRPHLWDQYRRELSLLRRDHDLKKACARLEEGNSGIEPIDTFARELVETGYMHNHARMWFASYWIHVAQLPWQLGADFFYRHLLDADPASNTLSWRWVAGLQTPGKSYMVTRSNIERFCSEELPRRNLNQLDNIKPGPIEADDASRRQAADLPEAHTLVNGHISGRVGVWLHGDDLSPETSPLSTLKPASICSVCSLDLFSEYTLGEIRENHMQRVMCDAIQRSGEHFGISPECRAKNSLAQTITEWAKEHQLKHVAAMRPTVGPLADCLPEIRSALEKSGIQLHLYRRPEDQKIWPLARKGFFPFWNSIRRQLDDQMELAI